jgi:hypothetical protein
MALWILNDSFAGLSILRLKLFSFSILCVLFVFSLLQPSIFFLYCLCLLSVPLFIQFCFFFCRGDQSVQEGCAGLSQGWLRGTTWCLALTCFVCRRSPKHVWSQWLVAVVAAMAVSRWWRPTCSLSVSWRGETFHGLGIQGAKVSTLPGASPLPSMTPASQQGPWFTELMLSASVSQSPFLSSPLLLMTWSTKFCIWIMPLLYFLLKHWGGSDKKECIPGFAWLWWRCDSELINFPPHFGERRAWFLWKLQTFLEGTTKGCS